MSGTARPARGRNAAGAVLLLLLFAFLMTGACGRDGSEGAAEDRSLTADSNGIGEESDAEPLPGSAGPFTRVLAPDTPYSFEGLDFEGRVAQRGGVDERTERNPHVGDMDGACHACHTQIAEEWAHSQHGLAWIDEHFQASLADLRRPQSCYGCHAPENLHGDGHRFGSSPYVREAEQQAWHFGISCATCHLDADGVTWLGPRGSDARVHPTAVGESFLGANANRLCIDCHRSDVGPVIGIARDYERFGHEKRCIDCHMGPVERPSVYGGPTRAGRSHHLLGPRDPHFLAQAFAPRAFVEGEQWIVELENRAAHRVPGLIGRVLRFEFELRDAAGETIARGEGQIDHEHPLLVDRPTRFAVPVEESARARLAGARVALDAWHDAPGFLAPVHFLAVELELAGAGE